MMSLIGLTLETLKDLDGGRPALAFQHAVEDAVHDCKDRPMDERPRKISMEFILNPIAEESDVGGVFTCTGVTGQFKVKTTLPQRQTKAYSFGLNRQGKLFFSEFSPTNVNQATFDDVDPATGKVARVAEEVEVEEPEDE
jgi:hypothetical protein